MDLYLHAACKADELSNDAGEGKGGLWTSYFIANDGAGDFNKKILKAYKCDGEEVI